MQHLTKESILAARQWFRDNSMACIAEVKCGAVRVNDPQRYFAKCLADADSAMAGEYDHTFTFRQRAEYIQTGE